MSADADKIKHLDDVIAGLEGRYYAGRGWLRFVSCGYDDQLSIDGRFDRGEFEALKDLPGLRELADDLNAATQPILLAYAKRLRQELANECLKLGGEALK